MSSMNKKDEKLKHLLLSLLGPTRCPLQNSKSTRKYTKLRITDRHKNKCTHTDAYLGWQYIWAYEKDKLFRF